MKEKHVISFTKDEEPLPYTKVSWVLENVFILFYTNSNKGFLHNKVRLGLNLTLENFQFSG